MNPQAPPDGLHRECYLNGLPSVEYTLKNGRRHGLFRRWHKNGQLAEECVFKNGLAEGLWRHWNDRGDLLGEDSFKGGTGIFRDWHLNGRLSADISYMRGEMTGRMRSWAEDGTLYTTRYFFEGRPVSKKRYLEQCATNPTLPRFLDEKTSSTLGNFMRRLRKEKRKEAKRKATVGDFTDEMRYDERCALEIKASDAKEALSWLEKGARGKRELGEMGRGEALQFVRKLYKLGAMKVWAVRLEQDPDGFESTRRLVVVLPKDPTDRGRMYEACSDQARPFMMIGTPAILIGQRYMAVSLL